MEKKVICEHQAQIARVLASAKRMEIIYALIGHEMTAGELARNVDVSMPNLSQHLSLMKQHRLVTARKEGLNMFYQLTSPQVLEVCDAIRRLLVANLSRDSELLNTIG